MSVDGAPQPTRLCAGCHEKKTIRGVWYLVNARDQREPDFLCEACFQFAPKPRHRPETPGGAIAGELPLHPESRLGRP